eukprot:TRINITY_DN8582_c0_g1_i1.p1 TRINITY_DN8582_c0_g1~~TRINITY_DN8582_c0_g1_i1.p1  ORF type:complete len:240 (+),score=29.12 TRINITY_DN8582_c0_g1_i1:75-794(+)
MQPSSTACLVTWLERLASISGDARKALVDEAQARFWDLEDFEDMVVEAPRLPRSLHDQLSSFEVAVVQRAWRADADGGKFPWFAAARKPFCGAGLAYEGRPLPPGRRPRPPQLQGPPMPRGRAGRGRAASGIRRPGFPARWPIMRKTNGEMRPPHAIVLRGDFPGVCIRRQVSSPEQTQLLTRDDLLLEPSRSATRDDLLLEPSRSATRSWSMSSFDCRASHIGSESRLSCMTSPTTPV